MQRNLPLSVPLLLEKEHQGLRQDSVHDAFEGHWLGLLFLDNLEKIID